MTDMKDRERGFENKYAHDAELQFKVEARRNRMLGEWAADLMGKSGDERAAYARDVVKADFAEAGDEDVYRKVKDDLGDRVSERELRDKMASLREVAKEQIQNEF
ncbi:DUF1476 domain-containing protein [Jannaschia sp. W003]|uniref:DUF1476 domain-containing protein n=1 Tax=Jannaschia sp. W003 TaxID=2867012 RepID=UPI0021A51771|nr:DUF1476 domain-containing protein [Jannaschia sp. W003]UWQ20904.1 DUF1476 domain-containing protein [Jannaschia sp. W003]